MKTESMLNTVEFSVFPLEFSRPSVSLFFFLWISPVALSLFWSVMPIKEHCPLAKTLLMLVRDYWFGHLARQCSPLCIHFSQQPEILSPILSGHPHPPYSYWRRQNWCLPIYSPSCVFPIWAIEYPFISRKFYACLCGRKSHLFQSAAPTGKDFCKFLSRPPSHDWQLC